MQRDTPITFRTWLIPVLLATAYTVSMLDRYILYMAIEPVKAHYRLSDTQLGLLAGFGFSLFYAAFGLLMGRLADRLNRRNLIVCGIFFWSLMTALTGFAQSVWQLIIARIGVAAGEAVLAPSAYSMVSDIFDRRRLPRAISIIYTGVALGPGIALLVGGLLFTLFQHIGPLTIPGLGTLAIWQSVMVGAGVPGLFIAAAILLFIREPRRQIAPKSPAAAATGGDDRLIPCFRQRAGFYGPLFLAMTAMSMFSNGLVAWMPSFYERRFGWSVAEFGMSIGILLAIAGTTGTLFASSATDRIRQAGHEDALVRFIAIAMLCIVPLGILATLLASPYACLAVTTFLYIGVMGLSATAPAALQLATPPGMRGQISALYLSCFGLITNGGGPLVIGLLTDRLFQRPEAIGYSLALSAATFLPIAALSALFALRGYRKVIGAQPGHAAPLASA